MASQGAGEWHDARHIVLDGRRSLERSRVGITPVDRGRALDPRNEILAIDAVDQRVLARCFLIPSPIEIARQINILQYHASDERGNRTTVIG